jgi:hypothetical protein
VSCRASQRVASSGPQRGQARWLRGVIGEVFATRRRRHGSDCPVPGSGTGGWPARRRAVRPGSAGQTGRDTRASALLKSRLGSCPSAMQDAPNRTGAGLVKRGGEMGVDQGRFQRGMTKILGGEEQGEDGGCGGQPIGGAGQPEGVWDGGNGPLGRALVEGYIYGQTAFAPGQRGAGKEEGGMPVGLPPDAWFVDHDHDDGERCKGCFWRDAHR